MEGQVLGNNTVINVLAQWTQTILQKEGDDIEIMERVGVPFRGVSVFTFGSMMQLKPCMGR